MLEFAHLIKSPPEYCHLALPLAKDSWREAKEALLNHALDVFNTFKTVLEAAHLGNPSRTKGAVSWTMPISAL